MVKIRMFSVDKTKTNVTDGNSSSTVYKLKTHLRTGKVFHGTVVPCVLKNLSHVQLFKRSIF